MATRTQSPRTAVIGLGMSGIAALKNFREVGLDATGFERNDYVGGLWRWTAREDRTSVLTSTIANISRQRSCYTDFPFPDDAPDYPTAEQNAQYIDSYTDHFKLRPHCRLGTAVERIKKSSDGKGWMVRSREGSFEAKEEHFDKVLVTTGTYSKPFLPTMEGASKFKGRIVHSQAFKDPGKFAKQRVIVVGLSNTGGDSAVELSKVAEKVFLSHRSGGRIFPRRSGNGAPGDHMGTRRLSKIALDVARLAPRLGGKLAAMGIERRMNSNPLYRPEWGLLPAGPIPHATPVANDYLFEVLADGSVTSIGGIGRFLDDGETVELTDGTTIPHVHAVICCTGYCYDFSTLEDPDADPTNSPTPGWDKAEHSNAMAYPRLYMGMFSPNYPYSLAFLGAYRGPSPAAFTGFDLMSQAIAQVWSDGFSLPAQTEIDRWCDEQYKYMLSQVTIWRIHKPGLPPALLEKWLNVATGNGLEQMLGWSWRAWSFWWNDRALYKVIMDGIDTPFVYRLFDGRRPKWDGARDAILRTNGRSA